MVVLGHSFLWGMLMSVDNPIQFPFARVTVEFSPIGGTYIFWELDGRFQDRLPYTYRLQYSPTASEKEDSDWTDIGTEMEDAFMAVDDEQRIYGMTLEGAYRLLLTTPIKTYSSGPVTAEIGGSSYSAWRLGQEMVRGEMLRNNFYFDDTSNILLKAKRFGPTCVCVNLMSGTPTSSRCTRCYGTGFDGGYFAPVPISMIIEHGEAPEGVHGAAPANTAKGEIATGRFCGLPIPQDRDIVVEARTGRRWKVHEASGRTEIGTYIVSISRQLKLINFGELDYTVPVTGD